MREKTYRVEGEYENDGYYVMGMWCLCDVNEIENEELDS